MDEVRWIEREADGMALRAHIQMLVLQNHILVACLAKAENQMLQGHVGELRALVTQLSTRLEDVQISRALDSTTSSKPYMPGAINSPHLLSYSQLLPLQLPERGAELVQNRFHQNALW